jgi:hypothetical protein
MGVYMELNEAKKVLKENGYLMESVKIENIEKFDRDIEFHTERIKKIRQDFIKIAEELEEPVFSKLGKNQPQFYVDTDYKRGYILTIQFDNSYIEVNSNCNVRFRTPKELKDFKQWTVKDAIQTIIDHADMIQ